VIHHTCLDCEAVIVRVRSRGPLPDRCAPCKQRTATAKAADRARRQRAQVERAQCANCGSTLRRSGNQSGSARFCGSKACRSAAAAARYARKRLGVPTLTRQQTCGHCRVEFAAHHGNRKYCSRSCGLAAYNAVRRSDGRSADLSAKRRALEKGAKVSPGRRRAVAERDGWMCQLCSDPVDSTVFYPAPDAAVIDHVVPLALGGEHAPSNWALTHSFCNSLKSDLSLSTLRERYPDVAERFAARMQLEAA
jgi:hypothetical protein